MENKENNISSEELKQTIQDSSDISEASNLTNQETSEANPNFILIENPVKEESSSSEEPTSTETPLLFEEKEFIDENKFVPDMQFEKIEQEYDGGPRRKGYNPNELTKGKITFIAIASAFLTSILTTSLTIMVPPYPKENTITLNKIVYNDIQESTNEIKTSEIATKSLKSIVSITNKTVETTYDFFLGEQEKENEGVGSGVIIAEDDSSIYILTNYHVIEDAKELKIAFFNDEETTGIVKGFVSSQDIALIEIKKSNLDKDTLSSMAIMNIGDSDKIEIGDEAIAIGNAMGFGQSVTSGIISGKDRKVKITDDTELVLLQVDCAINPGNSGGALLDSKGNLIGINTAKYTSSSVEGIGFAIPINTAMEMVEAIFSGNAEKIEEKPCIGITGFTINQETAIKYNAYEGICVQSIIPMSGAHIAGIQAGDIIYKVDETVMFTIEDLVEYVQQKEVGDILKVYLYRNTSEGYKEMCINVTLGVK